MSGERPGLEALYRSELRSVYAFLWRLGAQESEMDDLAHDVFVTAARRLSSFDPARPARPWLLGIAFRVFSDARRKRRPTETPSEAMEDPVPGPEASVERRQAQQVIRRALATLPEERRVAFVLHELEGLTPSEVSNLMQAPLMTTYSRLKTARDEVASAVRRFQLIEQSRNGSR
ncbi:MAG: RNA polymerase sigma factor [Myxococcaceae bacterium]|jgi:RNA polymerase sigma-70 factor (ECF subfamily)|nr:RNA polymerase sigma factor [Myxococcaceae bacterium]MCA3014744.1 RNA polymerase sigma factor [Myxococcaceae bacterium]